MQQNTFWGRAAQAGMVVTAAVLFGGCASIKSDSASAALQADAMPVVQQASSESMSVDDELMFQLMAGELAGHFGQLKESVAYYMQAARLSRDPQVAARATSIALYAEDEASALEAAQRWVDLQPTGLEARRTLAMLLVQRGDPEAAIDHFEYLLKHAPGPADNGFMLIGATLSQEKDAGTALKSMRMLVNRHPDEAQAHYAYANLALGAKRHDQAVKAANKALAIDPNLIEAGVVRARALLMLGRTDQAVSSMQQTVQSAPDNYDLRTAYAKMLLQVQRFEPARNEFSTLLKQRPKDADLLYTLGLLDLQQEDYAGASWHFSRLIKTSQRIDEARYYLGRVAQERERSQEAIEWFSQVEEGQYQIDAQVRIASILAAEGKLEQGRAQLKRARDSQNKASAIVQLYLAEGQILGALDQYRAGIDLFDRALSEYPGNSDLLYSRALMAEKVGRIDQLEADLHAILKDDPDNATALNALGFTLADRKKRVREAFGYIKRAYRARPDDPAVIDSMGWVHFRLGNYARAEQFLRRAFELLPDGEIAGHLSELMWARGHKEEARSVLREALNREPQHEYLLELRERYTP